MVDGIKISGSMRTAPPSPVAAPGGVAVDTSQLEARPAPRAPSADATSSTGSLAKAIASSPPVDKERVAQIKRAIATGTFPILPATIADRLLALKLEWTGRESQS